MAIYAIADLHLSLGTDKPMDIFHGWENYLERLETSWREQVAPEDTVVVAGDLSWALKLEQTEADFRFLDSLPGRKLLMKGNHDYWWSTRNKMESYFAALGLKTLGILHNNAEQAEGVWLCGSRGWMFENGAPHDSKIVQREAGRIRASLEAAGSDGQRLLFLHYPPIYGNQSIPAFFDVMEQYGVHHCYYGHLHGGSRAAAFEGIHRGVELHLVSADALGFSPVRII